MDRREESEHDWRTWDQDYHGIVQEIRAALVRLATPDPGYTAVLMQGSGTFSVEAVIGSAVPEGGTLLVPANGANGTRMVEIARRPRIVLRMHSCGELTPPDLQRVERALATDPSLTSRRRGPLRDHHPYAESGRRLSSPSSSRWHDDPPKSPANSG